MTICIAAPCLQNDELRIVIAADRMISNDDASGDIEFKFELLPSSLLALYSGQQSQALGLIYNYRLGLKKRAKVTVESLPKALYRIMEKRKQELIDMVVGMNLGGISFNEFVAAGGHLDNGVGAEIMNEVNEARLKIELIVAGFLPDTMHGMIKPIIIRVTEKDVKPFKNFLCIGVGTVPAEHALYRRGQEEVLSLDSTIYNLFEAKKMAEIAPGVGTATVMAVIKQDDRNALGFSFKMVRVRTLLWLDERYKEYGPKETFGFTIPGEYRSWD